MPAWSTASDVRARGGRLRPAWLAAACCVLLAVLAIPVARAQFGTQMPDRLQEQSDATRALIENAIGPPNRVTLADQATLRLDGGLQFAERDIARRYLRAHAMAEPEGLVGLFFYAGRADPWLATIRLVRSGHVDISAISRWSRDDLLASVKDQVARDNAERAARGLPPRVVTGWRIPPRYDPAVPSLLWSVQSYVSGVSTVNETDANVFLLIFGREAYFEINIITAGATVRENPGDIALFTDNLHFADGRRYADFVSGTDPVARHGLETALQVQTLRHVGFLEDELDAERLVIFIAGGVLVVGAGIMALALAAANARRNRRI